MEDGAHVRRGLASAAALAGHLATGGIDWALTGAFTAAAAVGAVSGARLQSCLSPVSLTRAFAAVVALIGVFLIVKSLKSLG